MTYEDGHTEIIHLSFTNESYAELPGIAESYAPTESAAPGPEAVSEAADAAGAEANADAGEDADMSAGADLGMD